MHKFRCPDGHEFEAKRNFYAHCPVCGKNAKRIYDGETNPRSAGEEKTKEAEETSKNNESAEAGNQETKESEEHKEQSKEGGDNSPRPKRVKVTREKTKEETTSSNSGESSKASPAKKIKIKRRAAPQVKKKIVTTRDRKMNKEKKEERATQWKRVRAFKIF